MVPQAGSLKTRGHSSKVWVDTFFQNSPSMISLETAMLPFSVPVILGGKSRRWVERKIDGQSGSRSKAERRMRREKDRATDTD